MNILRSVLHKIKHFHFWRGEFVTSCQDGGGATDARWSLVVGIKTCVWVGIRSSIVGYINIITPSKCWSMTRISTNCVYTILVFKWSFKWRKIFFIAQWKYERSWSLFVATTCYNVKYCCNIFNHVYIEYRCSNNVARYEPTSQCLYTSAGYCKDPGWSWSRGTPIIHCLRGGGGGVSNYMFPHKNVTLHLQGAGYNVLFYII